MSLSRSRWKRISRTAIRRVVEDLDPCFWMALRWGPVGYYPNLLTLASESAALYYKITMVASGLEVMLIIGREIEANKPPET